MDFPSTDGVQLAAHDLGGAPDAPPLVIAHANGFHGRCYQPMVDAGLGARYHCIAIDLRGHGDSTAPDGSIGAWSGLGEDVEALLDAIDAPPGTVHGFGHSFGGAALVMAELARPGTFAALWLFEPIVPPPGVFDPQAAGENPMAAAADHRREVFDSFDAAIANYASKPPMQSFAPEALRAYVEYGFAPQPDGTVRIKCAGHTEATFYRMGHTNHIFSRLAEVTCPVVVAVGEPTMGPPAFAGPVAEALPHGELRPFPHLDHFGPFEAPAEIARDVLTSFAAVG